MLPLLAVVYLLCYLDRSNIGMSVGDGWVLLWAKD